MPKPPDKFKRWMIASFFLIPLVLFGSMAGYYYLYTPVKMHIMIYLLQNGRTDNLAYKAIRSQGQEAVPYLIRGLCNKDPKIRSKSAGLIGTLTRDGHHTKKAVSALIKLLSDPGFKVRWEAAASLGYIGAVEAVSPLIRCLNNDPEIRIRTNAAWALGRIGSPKAVVPLIAALKEKQMPGVSAIKSRRFQFVVTQALEKITAQSFEDIHPTHTEDECQQIIQKWLKWWQENKEKYQQPDSEAARQQSNRAESLTGGLKKNDFRKNQAF